VLVNDWLEDTTLDEKETRARKATRNILVDEGATLVDPRIDPANLSLAALMQSYHDRSVSARYQASVPGACVWKEGC